MSIGTIPLPLEAANDQPWAKDVRFWLDTAKTKPADIVAASAWLKRQGLPATPSFPLTLANGRIMINDGTVGLRIATGDAATLTPGAYDFEVQATDQNGGVRQVRGVVKVLGGLGQ